MKSSTIAFATLIVVGLAMPAAAATISVNFGIALNDANAVDSDETAVVGNPDALEIAGSFWNNVLLRNSGSGSPDVFISNTTGGNFITLNNSLGAPAAELTSTIPSGGFANFGNVSGSNATLTGTAGLFQSFLNFGATVPTETLTISGLGSNVTERGYKVIAFFDIGGQTRTYGLKIGDQQYWTNDTSAVDSDPDNDGVINWIKTTATTSGTAVANANYAVFDHLSGSSFTLEGVGSSGRSVLSGLQIIPYEGDRALIDIGTSAGTPVSPDANGNRWNTLSATNTPLALFDADTGTDTGWRLQVALSGANAGFTGSVVSSTPGPGPFNVFQAYGDGWYDNTTGSGNGTFTFSGLDPNANYELSLWGNRDTNWANGAITIINGAATGGPSFLLQQNELLLLNFQPDAAGLFAFLLDDTSGPGVENVVLNAMLLQQVQQVPEPPTLLLAFVGLAAIGLLMRVMRR